MHPRAPVLLALGAAALLLAPAGTAPSSASVDAIPWDLIDCRYAIGIFPVDALKLKPYMPEGFRVGGEVILPAGLSGLGSAGVSQVGLEVDTCRVGAGLHGPVEGMQYASLWVAVAAPEELAVPGYGFYYVNFDTLVPDADRRAVLEDAGIPVHDGLVTDLALAGGFEEARRADLVMEGFGSFSMVLTGPPADLLGLNGRFVQFTPGKDGALARWRTDYHTHAPRTGAGVVTLEPDSWIAEVAGSPVLPARFLFGTWDYTDGLLEPNIY